jgi:hypothetical protein
MRGLHDIKTHSSLDRAGLLVGVAKSQHGLHRPSNSADSSGWDVNQHLYRPQRKTGRIATAAPLSREKVELHLVEVARDIFDELQQALAEGLSVSEHELERLRKAARRELKKM